MVCKKDRIPGLLLHKATGRARVVLTGRTYYLGRYGSKESRERYSRLIAKWAASNRTLGVLPEPGDGGYTIADLIADYMAHAKTYYVRDGKATREVVNIRYAVQPVLTLYGSTEAAEFGPKDLKAVRQRMVEGKLSRKLINQRIGIVRRMFKWAVSEELVEAPVLQALQAVDGLRFGRTAAKESKPTPPVSEVHFRAVMALVSPQITAMIELQWLTGMRPGEVTQMRMVDIDRSEEVWIYQPRRHKTQHHGKSRPIVLGPRARTIIKRFLKADPRAALFSPVDADAWNRRRRAEIRQSKITPSQASRAEACRRSPKRVFRDEYDTLAYARAITRDSPPAAPASRGS